MPTATITGPSLSIALKIQARTATIVAPEPPMASIKASTLSVTIVERG